MTATGPTVERLETLAFTVPTDGPGSRETDGTLEWDSTTCVVALAHAEGRTGLGYTYGDVSVARFIESTLAPAVVGCDVAAPAAISLAMMRGIRNAGRPGVGAMAVSAVDIALWDLHARAWDVPLVDALPRFHDRVPVYGSGGFCNYPLERLQRQLAGWVEQGIPRVKLKISRNPGEDPARLDAVRSAIGDETALFTDANGALSRKAALDWASRLRERWGASWLEEPVSSADLEGLRLIRDQGPPGLDVAAGEYAFVARDFVNLLGAGAVDCLQADVTRCGGITGILQAGALASAHGIDLSGHCAPAASAHALCGVERLRHLEYFHDHVRIEGLLFAGILFPEGGDLRPDRGRPGLGLELRWPDAERYCVHRGDSGR